MNKIVTTLMTATWFIVLINFILLCYVSGCYKCNYDQEALLAELDTRFVEQRVHISSGVIAMLIEREIAYEITQRKLWTIENLLIQNQLGQAQKALEELNGNKHLSEDEQQQVTMVLNQMQRK